LGELRSAKLVSTHPTHSIPLGESMKSLLWAALGGALLAGVTMLLLRRDH
jgi:hypothetical protein